MSALRTAIPQHLRTFVEPQIEQLSLRMESVRCGLYATLPKSLGEGFLWTAALGEGRFVSMHPIRLKKPLILEERPTDFFCVFSGLSATLRSLPNTHTEATAERESVLSFSQTGGTTRCLMRAGDLYESTSITYTPGYFESLRKRFPDDFGSGETDVARVARGGIRAHLSVRRGISPNVRLLPRAVAAPSRAVANRTLPPCRTCGLLEHARLFGVAALCVFAKMDCCCIWLTS